MVYIEKGDPELDKMQPGENIIDIEMEHEKKIRAFGKAIESDPRNAGAYTKRGVSKAFLERHKEAIIDFGKAIEIDPKNAGAHQERSFSYLMLHNKTFWQRDLEKSEQINTNN